MSDYKRFLQPQAVAQLNNIELKARLVVEGFITGLHRSPYHGFSVEFAEHRQYRDGDSLKHVDWKVLARTDRFYVKQFEEETNLRSMIAVDASASMKFASKGNISKFEYASYLAASLSYLLIKQRDAAGITLYDTKIRYYLPPNSRQSYLNLMLKALDSTVPANETGTAKALDVLAEKIKRRGLVIVISDLFDNIDSVMNALSHFRHKKHDVIVFQVLDPREIDFDFGKGATFIDMETGEKMITQPYQIQRAYMETMKNFLSERRKNCRRQKTDYHLIDTSQPFKKALSAYLGRRSASS